MGGFLHGKSRVTCRLHDLRQGFSGHLGSLVLKKNRVHNQNQFLGPSLGFAQNMGVAVFVGFGRCFQAKADVNNKSGISNQSMDQGDKLWKTLNFKLVAENASCRETHLQD